MRRPVFFWILLAGFLASCGASTHDSQLKLRDLNKREALSDFDEMVSTVRDLYGPLQYKEKRLGFKFDDWVTQIRQQIESSIGDTEYLSHFAEFLTRFSDAHVSIKIPLNASTIETYKLDLFVEPVEDKAIITTIGDSLKDQGISAGDELVTIDGQSPFDLLKIATKYSSMANPISEKQLLFKVLQRPAFIKELVPTSAMATLALARPDGTNYTRQLIWHAVPAFEKSPRDIVRASHSELPFMKGYYWQQADEINAAAGRDKMGAVMPFFMTGAVKEKFQIARVFANEDFLKKYGVDPKHVPDIFAGLYRFGGKVILLVRQASYSHDPQTEGFSNEDFMKAYQAILDQYEEISDVLVVDQTHNPGGSYCQDFFSLFVKEEKAAFVQRLRADRKWIIDLKMGAEEILGAGGDQETARSYANMAAVVEKSYDAGEFTTDPLPIMNGNNFVVPNKAYTWQKPMLVLTDELSASCGDAFPALIKNNKVAKIFGERTMGAGGNVEEVLTMSHSQAKVRLTRGLFTTFKPDGRYMDEDFVENNGIQPDYHYQHSVTDLRAGFIKYVENFSQKAVEQIPTN